MGRRADPDGNAVVLTVRKHKPTQRIRATFVAGRRHAQRGPHDLHHPHSSAAPTLAVAPDGSAVAAWQWHDATGWRVQAAVRRPGQPRFGKPQTISPPAPVIGAAVAAVINVAAGDGGRAAVTWQFGGELHAAGVAAARR